MGRPRKLRGRWPIMASGSTQTMLGTFSDTVDNLVDFTQGIKTNAASTFLGSLTLGVDDTGHDLKAFGATSGCYWLWDESADGVVQQGTLTVGVDDTGFDVKFFGATASAYLLWDESDDALIFSGAAELKMEGSGSISFTSNAAVPSPITMNSIGELTDDVSSGTYGTVIKQNYNTGTITVTAPALTVKNYVGGGTINGNYELSGIIVYLKNKATMAGGSKSSLASFHVHSSSTTAVDYGLRIFGDMTSAIDVTGGTVTSAIDGNNSTAITNLLSTASGKMATAGSFSNNVITGNAQNPDAYVTIDIGGTPYYLLAVSTQPA